MFPNPDPQPNVLERRRKILRAGFGVPVVSAVASGNALAAASATSLQRQLSNPVYPAVADSATAGNYLRVQLGMLVKRENNTDGPPSYYVDGNAIEALKTPAPPGRTVAVVRSSSYLVGPGQFSEFNVATNTEGEKVKTSPFPPLPTSTATYTYTQASGKFAALRFDSTGRIIGVGAGPAGQSAATQSIMGSFALASA